MKIMLDCDPGMVLDERPYRMLLDVVRNEARGLRRRDDVFLSSRARVLVDFDFVGLPSREIGYRRSGDDLQITISPRAQTVELMTRDQCKAWVLALVEHSLDVATGQAGYDDYPACSAQTPWPFRQVESLVRWGRTGKRWGASAIEDAFARRARCITDLVESYLVTAGLTSHVGPQLWLTPDPTTPRGQAVLNRQATVARIGVGQLFHQTPTDEQADIILMGVTQALKLRGQHEDLDWTAVAERAAQHVRDSNFRQYWAQQPWKSPSSHPRLRAHCEYLQTLDGAKLRLTIADGDTIADQSPWVPAGPSIAVLASRAEVTVNWANDTTVECTRPDALEPGTLRLKLPRSTPDRHQSVEASQSSTVEDNNMPPAHQADTHPRFSRHFTDSLYLDDGNDLAPFGSDEGSDILDSWLEHPDRLTQASTVRSILGEDVDDVDEFIAQLSESHPDLDAIVIGSGFTLLRLTGQIDPEGRQWTLEALKRTHRFYRNSESKQMLADLETFSI